MNVSVVYHDDAYASTDDLRAKLSDPDNYSDDNLIDVLAYATALVDARTDMHFGIISEQTIYDVRTDTAVLNTMGTVEEVRIGETVLDPSTYQVMPFGIRFYAPAGGMFYNSARPLTVEPIRSWWGSNGRGVTLTVTGSFGEPVNPLIRRATILLAMAELQEGESATQSVLADLPDSVRSLSVEGLSVSLAPGEKDAAGRVSTGNSTADRLIDLAGNKRAFVV